MPDYIWKGPDDVLCQIEVEPIGNPRSARWFTGTARRIYPDGLLPLALPSGAPAEWKEESAASALARVQLFLDRRFGYGTVAESRGELAGRKVFPVQRVPADMVIAGYRRYGCRICRIGEPNDDRFEHWIEHARREHGYQVVSDRRERAPWLPDVDRLFRVVRLVLPPAIADAPAGNAGPAGESLPRLMPRTRKV